MFMCAREVAGCKAEGCCCVYGMELGHVEFRDEPKAYTIRRHGRSVMAPHRSGLQRQSGDGVAARDHQKVDSLSPGVQS